MNELSVLQEIALTARKLRNLFDAQVRKLDLTLARARTLLVLEQPRPWNQTELAQELEVEQPTAVRLLDGLEKHGLIARVAVAGDRRSKRIELTDAALPHLRSINRITANMRASLLEGIDEDDLVVVCSVLRKMAKNADAELSAFKAAD